MTYSRSNKRLVYEVNFADLSTTSYTSSSGEITIDGNTWVKFTGAGGTCELVNGTGLTITSQDDSSGANAFHLGMPLDQFGIEGTPDGEVWWDVTASPGIASWADYTALFLGYGNIPEIQPSTTWGDSIRTPVLLWSQGDYLGSRYGDAGDITTDTNSSALVLPRTLQATYRNGIWSGHHADSVTGWPASMTFHSRFSLDATTFLDERWGPNLKFYETGTSEVVTITLRKMRVFVFD